MIQQHGATATLPYASEPAAGPLVRFLGGLWRFSKRRPVGAVCGVLVVAMIAAALAAPLVATHDPLATDTPAKLQAPSAAHYFGTDDLGRDVFSRVVYGARASLGVAFAGTALAIVVSLIIAMVSGYFGGKTDMIIQRIVDAIEALPGLLVILTVVTILKPSIFNLILLLGLQSGIGQSRVIRSQVLFVRGLPFVEASKAGGAAAVRILWRDIFPNVASVAIIVGSFILVRIVLAESTLSFLGFGIPPPEPTWGQMLSGSARPFMVRAPWMGLAPGLVLSLTVLLFNLVGDALRDELDPRLRGARDR